MLEPELPLNGTEKLPRPEGWDFARLVVLAGLVIGIGYYSRLWIFDPNGLSQLSDRLPYWDFTNLWAGGALAREGHVGWLFDVEQYRAALRDMFNPALPDQEWSYPPTLLLVGVPLSLLPIGWSYALFSLAGLAALYWSLAPLKLPLALRLVLTLCPAALISLVFGQNGLFTAALLFGCLFQSERRPLLSGLLAGVLTLKPHLGVLVPIVYLAQGNFRAFASATVTAIFLAGATGLLFGFEVWIGFLQTTRPLMSKIMDAPYPQLYHANALTVFILARSLGLDLLGSYVVQAAATCLAMGAVAILWRRPARNSEARISRVVFTALLTILATPYGYTYDAVPFSVAVGWWFLVGRSPNRYLFCLIWLYPYFAHLANFEGIGLGILIPAGLAVYAWRDMAAKAHGTDRIRSKLA